MNNIEKIENIAKDYIKSKTLLLTHTDLDGIGCHILLKRYFSNVQTLFLNYNEFDEIINEQFDEISNANFDFIFITDLSISKEISKKINEINSKIIFIDHHVSSLELKPYFSENLIMTEYKGDLTCGTDLLSIYLEKNCNIKLQSQDIEFIKLVRGWDTWTWVNDKNGLLSCQLNDLLSIYGRNDFIDHCLNLLSNNLDFPKYSDIDIALLNYHNSRRSNYIKQCLENIDFATIKGYTCGIVFADEFTSIIGNRICSTKNGIDIAMIISLKYKTISFRTIKEDINLSNFAKNNFNGGGHRKAAGSQISIDKIDKITKLLIKPKSKIKDKIKDCLFNLFCE